MAGECLLHLGRRTSNHGNDSKYPQVSTRAQGTGKNSVIFSFAEHRLDQV